MIPARLFINDEAEARRTLLPELTDHDRALIAAWRYDNEISETQADSFPGWRALHSFAVELSHHEEAQLGML